MNAEIVTSGTELLLGEIVDTNSTYIARALRDVGVNLYYKTSVGDNVGRMAEVLALGLRRSDLIITTGGLGPTVDDVTRPAVAQATGRELVLYPDCLAAIEAMFARWGRPMGENNRRQAYLPAGATPISNPVGTAPGFIVEDGGGSVIIALPGVPREMEYLMQSAVLPYLAARLEGARQAVIRSRTLRTVALGESWIDEQLDDLMRATNPTVGLAAHQGACDIRITARAATDAEAEQMIAGMEAQVRGRLRPNDIYGLGDETLESVTGRLLAQAGVRLALVESATGGDLARALAGTPAGAAALTAAYVVSTPEELAARLNVGQGVLTAFGWVSQMAAAAAAAALIDTYEAGWGLAVFGAMEAGDDVYGTDPGETWAALATPDSTEVRHYHFGGQGKLARTWVTLRVLDLLRRAALDRLAAMQTLAA